MPRGSLFVDDEYHDTLFPYSELKNTFQMQLEKEAANGVSKVYIGNQWSAHYQVGEPVFIYRKYTGERGKRFRSCLTSLCVVTGVFQIKSNGKALMDFEQFEELTGNKSVFSQQQLYEKYCGDRNLMVIQLLYCGYFGAGHNVNMDWLANHGLWAASNVYPTNIQLSPSQCSKILNAGGMDLHNVFGGEI